MPRIDSKSTLALLFSLSTLAASTAVGATWPMKQRDAQNTGRADYTVPPERMNDTFFNFVKWQKRSPGPLGATSMAFFDGAGAGGSDIVVGGYHWPKGVQGMDRHSGRLRWAGNPRGGETIGVITPAFSPDGSTLYVVNDATDSTQFPKGHPLMAFATSTGPASFRHNGGNVEPGHTSMISPTIAADGRVFLHSWVDRPYAATDTGSALVETWAAATGADCGYSDPALYDRNGQLYVVIAGRSGYVKAYNGATGAERWSRYVGYMMDASVTIDPSNGRIYVGAGSGSIYAVGLDIDGNPLWSTAAKKVFDYVSGSTNAQRAQATGCLSHDGSTYYFQTNSSAGDGRLYAVNTATGALKWSYPTGSKGWETHSSCPIVTTNGVVIVGNNENRAFLAVADEGTAATLLDTLAADANGGARTSATLAPDGTLYLPLRMTWFASNGDGDVPTNSPENLFVAFDVTAEPDLPPLPPPANQSAVAGNHAVMLSWSPVLDPSGAFLHYAVYRSTASFESIAGMTPIATVSSIAQTQYTDGTAANGTRYYYAVTTVGLGGEQEEVQCIGPRTPFDETDLQVVAVSRTPKYPRYHALYTYYYVSDPSGFGPYGFSAATGLGGGQDANTQRWPNIGQHVTYTATVRNRGTNPWNGTLAHAWQVDGATVQSSSVAVNLAPGESTTFDLARIWDGESHDVGFSMTPGDARSGNNSLSVNTKSVAFLSYVDRTYAEKFREATVDYPQAADDDFIDWVNRHMHRFNEMFAAADCDKRVHFDVLEMLEDSAPDPGVDTIYWAVFPFRYRATDGSLRFSGYYSQADDIDYGLLHEMGHQLGLIDLYQLDLPGDLNQVSGLGYSGPACLMHGCSPFLSRHSSLAMNHWLNKAHGYFGQYLYQMPDEVRLRILGFDGRPLAGATVKVYQKEDRPGLGQILTDQIKYQGQTDADGYLTLPNVPIDPDKAPTTFAGDELRPNPFGYVAVVGYNGVMHFRVEYNGGVDYAWLDIPEVNVAYWEGQTDVATFDRRLALGGPVQTIAPDDMAEPDAGSWAAWAQGSTEQNTFAVYDTGRKIAGTASLKFVTDGGFDTYVRYPRDFTANWDLSCASTLRISFYAQNSQSFQESSPWIRLKDADNNYFQYRYYRNGSPIDVLNEAIGRWRSYEIPLNPSNSEPTGWRRIEVGTPDLSRIQFVEIHSDTWGGGFTLWVDGVSFDVPGHPPADLDGDCDVDLDDLQTFVACAAGPALPQSSPGCGRTDFDGDGDTDSVDFGYFQRAWTGGK